MYWLISHMVFMKHSAAVSCSSVPCMSGGVKMGFWWRASWAGHRSVLGMVHGCMVGWCGDVVWDQAPTHAPTHAWPSLLVTKIPFKPTPHHHINQPCTHAPFMHHTKHQPMHRPMYDPTCPSPKSQFNPTWYIRNGTTWYCCYSFSYNTISLIHLLYMTGLDLMSSI